MSNNNFVHKPDVLKNAPTARTMPASGDHHGLAAYWGFEAGMAMLAVRDGTSTNIVLDAEHAWRAARIAGYHWSRLRGLKGDMF